MTEGAAGGRGAAEPSDLRVRVLIGGRQEQQYERDGQTDGSGRKLMVGLGYSVTIGIPVLADGQTFGTPDICITCCTYLVSQGEHKLAQVTLHRSI